MGEFTGGGSTKRGGCGVMVLAAAAVFAVEIGLCSAYDGIVLLLLLCLLCAR